MRHLARRVPDTASHMLKPSQQPSPARHGISVSLAELIALRQEARCLNMTPRGKVLGTRSGGHLSRFRGRGMEFDESRVYLPGDDPRNMDWRVTARSGHPHVKLFREERERPVWLLVDIGASMRFGTRVAFKSVVAARAAALLGWAAADKGDRVGGLIFDEARCFQRQPAVSTRGVLPLLNALVDLTAAAEVPARDDRGMPHAAFELPESQDPESCRIADSLQGSSLPAAARHIAPQIRPGSLVFLLSDFAGLNEDNAAWLAQLGRSSEVVLIQVYDPLEAAAPPPGLYPATDGVRRGVLDTAAAPLREGWHRRFAEHTAMLETLSQRYRAHLVRLCTDQPIAETLSLGLGPRRLHGGAGR